MGLQNVDSVVSVLQVVSENKDEPGKFNDWIKKTFVTDNEGEGTQSKSFFSCLQHAGSLY